MLLGALCTNAMIEQISLFLRKNQTFYYIFFVDVVSKKRFPAVWLGNLFSLFKHSFRGFFHQHPTKGVLPARRDRPMQGYRSIQPYSFP